MLPSGVPSVLRALGCLPGDTAVGLGWEGGLGASVAETGAPEPLDFARTALLGVLPPLSSL